MNRLIYSVPLVQMDMFSNCDLVVRCDQPTALVEHGDTDDLERIAYVQLQSLPDDSDCLIHWAKGLAIDLVLYDPEADFAQLYRSAKLADNHPVRVSLPVVAGFDKAVKLADSLGFSVKLDLAQPDAAMSDILARVLDAYLHQPTVSQPIEPFHSLLLAFCQDTPASLWAIQEEDPAQVRYIGADGQERLPGRLSVADPGADPAAFVARWSGALVAENAECSGCAFFNRCLGYFKWPDRDYDCAAVKGLLHTLRDAGETLQRDLAAARKMSRDRS